MTLDDHERPKHTVAEKIVLQSAPKKLNEDRPMLSVAKCRPMVLVSRNIRYMRIFAGDLREGASKDSVVVDDDIF